MNNEIISLGIQRTDDIKDRTVKIKSNWYNLRENLENGHDSDMQLKCSP